MKQLLADTGLGAGPLLSMWSDIGSFGDASLYQQLFENRSLSPAPDADFALNITEQELAYKLELGTEALQERLVEREVPIVLDPGRRSAV